MPTWNGPTLAASALMAYYVLNGVRGALGDESIVPDAVKSSKLSYVHALGYHMLMDACLILGIIVNDIAHVMMPFFVAAMLVVVYSHFTIAPTSSDAIIGAAPAGVFALVFAYLARGAPSGKLVKWNLASFFFSLQATLILVVGIAMLFGDSTVIPEQMKPLDSLSQLKLIATTELTLSSYLVGSILTGHAQTMQPWCGAFLLVAIVLHYVIGDIEGCPMIVVLAMAHLCLGLFWKGKEEQDEKKP